MTAPHERPLRRLTHFDILDKLGEGGMGQVYRARDTRLDRDVAIKILPAALLADRDRLVRFEREARVLASLTHPHIAGLFDVGEHEGTRFLVMELVPGGTLDARIARGPLPVREALPLAIQITEALEAAHKRGIVHRDLKPANIMIDEAGGIKVLDFGVAKALMSEPDSDTSPSSVDAPTQTSQATEAGLVLGTAAYMSPEQARGAPVDERTDIWAFGCVLFEMLTGRRPFARRSNADTLGAVLSAEPDWSLLPSTLQPVVRRLLRRCLAKEPGERIHHIADARIELVEALTADPADEPRSPGGRALAVVIGAALGALLGAGIVWLGSATRSDATAPRPSRWTLDVSTYGHLDLGGRLDPLAVSPDGGTLAFVVRDTAGRSRLFIRMVGDLDLIAVSGSDGAANPFFSPDGRFIGFFAGDRLKKAAVGGGTPVDLAVVPLDSLGAAWAEDGTIVFASYASGLWSVDDEGGEPSLLTPGGVEGTAQHRWPSFLPGDRRVLFTLQTNEGPHLAIFDRGSREYTHVTGVQEVIKARYLPTGHLLMAQAGALLAARFDPREGRLLDTPTPVLTGVSTDADRVANFEVSAGGTLVYVGGDAASDATLTWTDREGREQGTLDDRAAYVHPRLSPDGSRLAVEVGSEVGDRHIEIFDLQRGTRTVLATEGRSAQPAWHPDGRRLAVGSERDGSWDLHLLPVSGPGAPEPLLVAPFEQWLGTFTPSGDALVFYQVDQRTARDLWVLHMGNGTTRPFRATAANERGVRLSPEGNWLAYVSNESGRDEVYVESFPEPGTRWTVSTAGGTEPVWAPDGTELFYREGGRMMSVAVSSGDDLAPSLPRLLFEGPYEQEIVGNANFDVARDGRFLMIRRQQPSSAELHVALDFMAAPGRGGGER